jgi:glycosyltransferase involved in cell wall biosynthesis
MVRQGEIGLLTKVGDIDGLADALLCLLCSPTLRMGLGQSGRKIAMEDYRAEVVVRRTYDVHQRTVTTVK